MTQPYQKNEFCKDVGCIKFDNGQCIVPEPKYCIYTAKEFHQWLKQQGFSLTRRCHQQILKDLPFTLKAKSGDVVLGRAAKEG